jgi:hypothetical protein
MNCLSCGWSGDRSDLTTFDNNLDHNRFTDSIQTWANILNINNWSYCPTCKTKIETPISSLILEAKYNSSILSIRNTSPFALIFRNPTIIHLGRILDFDAYPKKLRIIGYKNYTNFVFNLMIETEDTQEAAILIKIMHILHLHHFRCTYHDYENIRYFGRIFVHESHFPITPCSFCARYYAKVYSAQSWPLSYQTIENYKLDHIKKVANIPAANNKFSKIFGFTKSNAQNLICYCNEISTKPNPYCDLHNHENNLLRH